MIGSKRIHGYFGIGVSVLLLGALLWFVDIREVVTHMREANLWVFVPALGMLVLHFLFRAWRWRYLLAQGESVAFRSLFDSIQVGCLANFVLPLRAGEFVRPLLLSRQSEVTFAAGFASVVTERFFDLAAVLVFFAVMVQFLPGVPDWVYAGAWSLGVVAGIILGFILLGGIAPVFARRLNDRLSNLLPEKYGTKVKRFLEDLLSSAEVTCRPKNLFAILVLTLCVWATSFVFFYISLGLLELPQHVGLAIAVGVIVALAVAAPSAPGFVGVYQTACVAGFSLFAVEQSSALAYSILTHIIQYALFLGYGGFVLWRAGLRLGELERSAVPTS